MATVTALGLFSGGLDSILSCRLLMRQGIRVVAVKFVTPFFDHHLLADEGRYVRRMKKLYGIDVQLADLSMGYIDLLRNPAHGFGKHFNPCIDCKILMLTRAREMMPRVQASFLFTGEVLGQRPMSQRRDTLRIIERDSGCTGLLLRPLCAKRLDPTRAELEGLVDREQLLGFTGRGRRQQMDLAESFGISEYPNPAGGCVLTDPNLGERIQRFYQGLFACGRNFTVNDINLLLVGRQFRLPGGHWLVLGRNKRENERIRTLVQDDDIVLRLVDRPGPTGLLRYAPFPDSESAAPDQVLQDAASLIVRYGRKTDGKSLPGDVRLTCGAKELLLHATPMSRETLGQWKV